MPVLNPVSLLRRVLMALLIGVLFLTNSAFVNAQGQTTDPYARQRPANGVHSQLPQALAPAQGTTAANLIKDPSFEAAYNSSANWMQYSENFFTPLCIVADCGNGNGTAGPRTGSVWAWFGGVNFSDPEALNPEFAYLQQNIMIPSCGATLKFYFRIGQADPGSGTDDYFIAQLNTTRLFRANATQKSSYASYKLITATIPPGTYTEPFPLYFFSEISDQLVTFNLDDISVVPNCLIVSGHAGIAGATINYTGGSVTSSFTGHYSFNVPVGWSGTVTPSKSGYTFSPASRTYTNLVSYQLAQQYTATPNRHSISGNTGVGGVSLKYMDGTLKTVVSQLDGSYFFQVPRGWSGTVTPSKSGYIFSPVNKTYTNVTANQIQSYTAIPLYTIAGDTGVAGVTLSYTDGTPRTVTSQPDGTYSFTVPAEWSGTVTPTHPCFSFNPASRDYNSVLSDQTAQDYPPTFLGGAGCADIDISLGGEPQGRFAIPSEGSTRVSFAGLDNGPVQLESTNAVPLIGAERLIYKVSGVQTSFTEMMGLPDSELDKVYWLPWYNNVGLDTQLRFANVTEQPATVTVTIGGVAQTPINLEAGESTRISYPDIDSGPVKIESTQNIVAAERVIYKIGGVQTSFSEMMALPEKQLDTTYWFPWYNNIGLDSQLRFANVTDQPTTVTVTIGDTVMPSINLEAGESTRISYPSIDSGPVKIESTQNIVAAERVIYKVNGVHTSFSEMMGLPNSGLDNVYWLPWYNNIGLDTQLRIANVTDQPATITVTIGGVAQTPINLEAGESTRISYPSIDSGPVKIESTQNIVAAERVIYKVNGIYTSFSEMMALPEKQLDTTYWFPWYNNIGLDTQLRFGVP